MTKDELADALEAEKRSNAALRGQITKLKDGDKYVELLEAARILVAAIDKKGLQHQCGNRKELSNVRRLIA